MKEQKYKLTEKGKKLLKELNDPLNMEDYAAKLLGYTPKKENNEG